MSIEKYFKRSQEKILPSPHGSLSLSVPSRAIAAANKEGTTSAELSDHDLEEARKVQQVFTRRKSDDRQTRCNDFSFSFFHSGALQRRYITRVETKNYFRQY